MEVPKDPRPQFSFADLAVASLGLGRMPPSQQIGPDRYIIAGYWPQTPTRNSVPSSGRTVVETQPQPEPSKSSAAARAIWPNLK